MKLNRKVFVVSDSPQMSSKVKQDHMQSLDSWLAWLDAQSVIWLALVLGMLVFWSFIRIVLWRCCILVVTGRWWLCQSSRCICWWAHWFLHFRDCWGCIIIRHMSRVSYRYLWLGSLLCDSDVAWLNVIFVTSEHSIVLVIGDPIRVWCDIFGLNVSWFPLISTVISEPDGLTWQVDIVVLLWWLQMCWALVAKVGLLLIS